MSSYIETTTHDCKCTLSIRENGEVNIKPCEGNDCDVGTDCFADPDIFLDALRDWFRFGGTLRHHPEPRGTAEVLVVGRPIDRQNDLLQPPDIPWQPAKKD